MWNRLRKILFLLLCFTLFSNFFIYAETDINIDKPIGIAVIYSFDIKSYIRNNVYEYTEDGFKDFVYKQPTQIKTFFLNKNLSKRPFNKNSNNVIDRIEKFNPDYIITFGDSAYLLYSKSLRKFENVAILAISEINLNAAKKISNYTTYYDESELDIFFKYLKINGIDLPIFYIFRDVTYNSYEQYIQLKSRLHEKNYYFNIQEIKVNSIQDLRRELTLLHGKPKGIIIPIFTTLIDFDTNKIIGWESIIKIIVSNNYKNIELIMHDNGVNLGAGISIAITYKYCRKDYNNEINHIKTFFRDPYFGAVKKENFSLFVNEKRLLSLGGNSLLQNISSIDCLVE